MSERNPRPGRAVPQVRRKCERNLSQNEPLAPMECPSGVRRHGGQLSSRAGGNTSCGPAIVITTFGEVLYALPLAPGIEELDQQFSSRFTRGMLCTPKHADALLRLIANGPSLAGPAITSEGTRLFGRRTTSRKPRVYGGHAMPTCGKENGPMAAGETHKTSHIAGSPTRWTDWQGRSGKTAFDGEGPPRRAGDREKKKDPPGRDGTEGPNSRRTRNYGDLAPRAATATSSPSSKVIEGSSEEGTSAARTQGQLRVHRG